MKKRMCSFGVFICLLLHLAGCSELAYDPSVNDNAPAAPGAEYRSSFKVRETNAPTYSPQDLSKEMPLSMLLDIALYNNPSTRASWSAARAAAFAYRASLSAYYPAILYSGNLTQQKTNGSAALDAGGGDVIDTSTDNGTSVVTTGAAAISTTSATNSTTLFDEITGTFLVFDFGGRDAQAELALYTLEQSNWQHNSTMQQVMLSVINAYTSYLGNKALVLANEQNLKDAEIALDASQKMRLAGLATLTDVLSAQTTVEQMRLNLEQAKGAEKTAFADLLIILGFSPESNLCVVELPEKLPVIEISGNICTLLELAKENRPDIGAALAAVKQQEAQLGIAYSAGLPTLTFTGSASRLRFLKPQRKDITDQSISLQWNYPLFQGYYYVNQQKQVEEQIQEALALLDVTTSQAETDVVTNYYAFKTAEAALPASEAVLEYSQRAYRGMLAQYKVGTSSILDVLNILTTLSNARSQQVLTRVQWAASLANLAFAVGVLQDTSGGWEAEPPKRLYQVQFKDNRSL